MKPNPAKQANICKNSLDQAFMKKHKIATFKTQTVYFFTFVPANERSGSDELFTRL